MGMFTDFIFNYKTVNSDSVVTANQKAGRSARQAGKEFVDAQKKIAKTNKQFTNLSKDANRAGNNFKGLGKAVSGFNQVLGVGKIYAMSNALANMVNSSIDAIEQTNLFNVALGKMAEEADGYIQAMNKGFGFDVTNMRTAVGTFSLLGRSMGMTSENASILATNTNKLAYDLSSMTNVPINQVMQDLRSGLVGQSETVYKYGIDVTEASLKTEALARGMEKSVRNMSQGEKMALRYSVMLRQTTLAQGDFARTINTPANQLKILSERFVTLGRSIGSIFIPMLTKILPILNAIVLALINIFNMIASIFGYEAPIINEDIGNQTFSGIEDGANSATDAVNGTSDSLKKLKNFTMGFDELNVIDTTASAGGGGAGGAGVSAGMPLDLEKFNVAYDNMLSKVSDLSRALSEKIQPVLETILKIAGLVAIAFLSWKIANGILGVLTNPLIGKGLLETVTKIGTKLKGITGVGLTAVITVMIARFIELYAKSEDFRLGLKKTWEFLTTMFSRMDDIFIAMGEVFTDLIPKGWIEHIKTEFSGLIKVFEILDGDITDVMITFGGLMLLFIAPPLGVALFAFEALTLAIRAVGHASSSAIEQIDMFAGVGEETKTKLEPFLTAMNAINANVVKIDYSGLVVDEATVSDMQKKLEEVTTIIMNELSADKNQDLANLNLLNSFMPTAELTKLQGKIETYYSNSMKAVQNGQERINEIMAEGLKNGGKISQEGWDEINTIQNDMQNLGIIQISESQIEYETIMRNLKDNTVALSVEQASEILKNAKATRNGTVADAENQYSSILLSAQRLLETGTINRDEYNSMITSAREAKDSTIQDANAQYQGIYDTATTKLGELSSYIDENTLEVKTKWDVFYDGLSTKVDSSVKDIKKFWKDQWTDLKNDFANQSKDLQTGWDKFWNTTLPNAPKSLGKALSGIFDTIKGGFIDTINSFITSLAKLVKTANSVLEQIGKAPIKLNLSLIPNPYASYKNTAYTARGGSLEDGQSFIAGELGKLEAVGSYKGKTTVMPLENTDFVDAMYNAVASAMRDNQDTGGKVVETVVNLDGEVIYKNQQEVSRNRGYDFGMGVFGR